MFCVVGLLFLLLKAELVVDQALPVSMIMLLNNLCYYVRNTTFEVYNKSG